MIIGIALAITATVLISRQPGENIQSRRDRTFKITTPQTAVRRITPADTSTTVSTTAALPLASKNIQQPPSQTKPTPAKIEQPPTPAMRYHIIKQGETLSSIAMDYYGSRKQVETIVAANPITLKNPDKVRPGMRIAIPK